MYKKLIYIIIASIIVVAAGIWHCSKPLPVEVTDFDECVAKGYTVLESYPRQCKTPDGTTFVEDIGNVLEKTDLIRVRNIRPNQEIESPLVIEGEARGLWYFEGDFPVKVFDANNKLLGMGIARAQGEWMTEDFVPFEAEIEFSFSTTKKGLVVLEKDNPSGLPENDDQLRIPVFFEEVLEPNETMTIKAYFNNSNLDPEFSCNKVFPVERTIIKTQAVARAALEELLRGPLFSETAQGFFTNINQGVKIQSLTIENGVAKVDFDEQLEFQVGGSCKVAAIRAQITETLKQFLTVDSVIISIDGRTEDILQP